MKAATPKAIARRNATNEAGLAAVLVKATPEGVVVGIEINLTQ